MIQSTTKQLLNRFVEFSTICTDSRKIRHNDMYIALKGTNFNGNHFAQSALDAGASCVVVDDPDTAKRLPPKSTLFVRSGLIALQQLATAYRKQVISHIPLLCICGSNGKTTTKNLTAAVLATKYNVYQTLGNLNNHIGVPLSILSMKKDHQIAVLEFGSSHKGDHTLLCQIAQPNYALITNCGKDHLEGYGSFENVIQATKEVLSFGEKEKTIKQLFLNTDDDKLSKMIPDTSLSVWVFGRQHVNDNIKKYTQGKIKRICPYLRLSISPSNNNAKTYSINTRLFGRFQLSNVLAAVALGEYFTIPNKQIKSSIEGYAPSNNRSQYADWRSNKILLDAYNANPSSIHAVLDSFIASPNKKKIIILGAMSELGCYEKEEHTALIQRLAKNVFYRVVLIGHAFQELVLSPPQNYHLFEKTQEAKTWLEQQSFSNCFILVKGSRKLELESLFTSRYV